MISLLRKMRGFTMVELLVVLSILIGLGLISFPIYGNYFSDIYSKSDILKITNLMKSTRQKSFASLGDSSYGFYLDKSIKKIIFYKGDSFLERETENDTYFDYESSFSVIYPENNIDINFLKGGALPNEETVFLLDLNNNENKSIVINKFGGIFIE